MKPHPLPPLTEKQQDRFWAKVDASGPCWEWTGAIQDNGYGTLKVTYERKPHPAKAHRVAYSLLIGPIPDDMVVDHLCRNRKCVNPDHMRIVTHKENVYAGINITAQRKRATHCARGHEFTPENTANRGNARKCRECERMMQRGRYYQAKEGKTNVG